MNKKAADVLELIAQNAVRAVHLRFAGADGAARSASLPAQRLDAAALLEGIPLEPGVVLVPDAGSAHLDPFAGAQTLVLACDVVDGGGDDPRLVVKRAEARLISEGIADAVSVGCELSYHVFAGAAFENAPDATGYRLDAATESELSAVRADVVAALDACGLEAGLQCALPFGQSTVELGPASPCRAGDAVLCAKHAIKSVAERHDKSATFMPLPMAGRPGNALRLTLGLLKDGKSPFFDKDGWSGASQKLLYFVGGVLAHAGSLSALCRPSLNSYTLSAGACEPLLTAFGPARAATLVAVGSPSRELKARCVEFRGADLSANPHYAIAAMLCAGLDGIARRIDPISAGYGPFDGRVATGPGAPAAVRERTPTLGSALDELERDSAYLTAGGVFGAPFLRRWVEARRADVAELATRPHPYEFERVYAS